MYLKEIGAIMKITKGSIVADPFPTIIRNRNKRVKSGETVSDSGIYRSSKSKQNTTLTRGETAPPTALTDEYWYQVVDTNFRN